MIFLMIVIEIVNYVDPIECFKNLKDFFKIFYLEKKKRIKFTNQKIQNYYLISCLLKGNIIYIRCLNLLSFTSSWPNIHKVHLSLIEREREGWREQNE